MPAAPAGLSPRIPTQALAAVAAVVAALITGGVLLLGALLGGASEPKPAAAPDRAATALPLYFIENRGQTDDRARYYMHGRDASVFFTSEGLSFSLAGKKEGARRWGLKLGFLGAQAHPQPVGQARTDAKVSYFKGSRADWKTGVPTYSRVAYRNVWPGIDVIYSGAKGRLKYSFLVQPGADPSAIQMGWEGASGVRVNPQGQLEVSTPVRKLRDEAPVSYQQRGGRRVKVATSYSLGKKSSYGFNVAKYDRSQPLVIDPAVLVYSGYVGGTGEEQANNVALDEDRNLYVVGATTSADFPTAVGPSTTFNAGVDDAFIAKVKPDGSGLVYAGYIGGGDRDTAIQVAVTPSGPGKGAVYVAGSTSSCNEDSPANCAPFPTTPGSFNTGYGGGPQDAWLAKVKADGSGLDYAGYIGGAGTFATEDPANPNNEQANGVAVDASGDAYVTGFTASSSATFPTGEGFTQTGGSITGFDTTLGNGPPNDPPATLLDAFAVKINEAGSAFEYATYLGGGAADAGTNVALEQPFAGAEPAAFVNVYAGSNEASPGAAPPVVPGAPNFFGGFPIDAPAGSTPFDATFNGAGPEPDDAAVIKLNPAGNDVLSGTYVGGEGDEQPFGNAVDINGNVYLTGRTNSDETSFPDGDGFGDTKPTDGFDEDLNGPTPDDPEDPDGVPSDTFVVKLNSTLSSATYATYLGGARDEQSVAIAVDNLGRAYVAGQTDSADGTFPATNGPDSTYNGGPTDAFAASLAADGRSLGFAGFIGGALSDIGLGMAVDSAGNAYVAGSTESDQCEDRFPARGGPDVTKNGDFGVTDAFVAKIDPTGTATQGARPFCPVTPGQNPPPGGGQPQLRRAFPGCPLTSTNVILGSAGPDSGTGTLRGDRIFAGTGDDKVDGLAGDDCIDLGLGRDQGQGGLGADLVLGGDGNDRVVGNDGNDRLRGGPGRDNVNGGFGNDALHGQSGEDRVSGSRGRDRINGGSRADIISAGSGNDRTAGDQGNDRINGNSGNDVLEGNSGNDRITGSTGADRISGGSGNDRINSRDGRRDRVNCGRGRDRVVADRADRLARNCERASRRGR